MGPPPTGGAWKLGRGQDFLLLQGHNVTPVSQWEGAWGWGFQPYLRAWPFLRAGLWGGPLHPPHPSWHHGVTGSVSPVPWGAAGSSSAWHRKELPYPHSLVRAALHPPVDPSAKLGPWGPGQAPLGAAQAPNCCRGQCPQGRQHSVLHSTSPRSGMRPRGRALGCSGMRPRGQALGCSVPSQRGVLSQDGDTCHRPRVALIPTPGSLGLEGPMGTPMGITTGRR